MSASTYVYSNRTAHAVSHHRYLADILDEFTRERLLTTRTSLSGLSCLEVGAGAGSVAVFLADQVGDDGRVVATDLNPMPIPYMRRLKVVPHDITCQPIPHQPYDLIHARLVLMHLPERREVLRTLANALVPGGMLVIEDWDMTWRDGRVLHAPSETDRRQWTEFHDCLIDVFTSEGRVDPGWASAAPEAMVDAGLVDVQAEVHTRSWRGGEPGCLLVAGSTVQLGEKLIKRGMSPRELDRVRELMADPRMIIRMPPLVSTVGCKPWRQ